MKAINKISITQAVSLMVLVNIFSQLNFIPAFNVGYDIQAMVEANVISVVAKLILAVPLMMLLSRYEMGVLQIAQRSGTVAKTIIGVVLLGVIYLNIIGTIFGFQFFLSNAIYIENTNNISIVLSFILCSFLAYCMGLEGLGRAGVVVMVMVVIGVVIIWVSLGTQISTRNILPTLEEFPNTLITTVLHHISRMSELIVLAILMGQVQTNNRRKQSKWIVISIILVTGIIGQLLQYLMVGVLGEYAKQQTFPFYTLTSLSTFGTFDRLDVIYMMLWTMVSLIRVGVLMYSANYCIEILLPRVKKKMLKVLIIVAVLPLSIVSVYNPQWYSRVTPNSGIYMSLILVMVPVVLMLIGGNNEKGNTDSIDTISGV